MERLYKTYFKRMFDVIFSFFGIIALSPIMIVIAILVRVFLGSPIVFKQARPGLQGKIFTIYKFRTMKFICDNEGIQLADGKRLTKFGKILRRLSLDELPELFNVLKGEISLVGPRPLLMAYLSRYTAEQLQRHLVKPGITGWAQVKGRNALRWEEKFQYDLWYVKHVNFILDMKILWLTFLRVLNRAGISSDDHATMSEFMGLQNETLLKLNVKTDNLLRETDE